MRDRGLEQFDLVNVTSVSTGETERTVPGYRAVRYEIPPGWAAGYMPELSVLCGIADFSTQSEQPLTKHLVVEVTPSRENGRLRHHDTHQQPTSPRLRHRAVGGRQRARLIRSAPLLS